MMSQPTRWFWGVIPLALLWGAGNLVLDDAIQRDVASRAERAVQASAGAAPGVRPVTAQVEGRDVTIGGEVMSADGAAKAMAQLRAEFGVRRALGGLSQAVAQKPYSWFVSRLPDAVTLGGFVPDIAVADANAAAAAAAVPGLRIDDRQTVAFGAPDGFAAMTAAMVAALPQLASGRIALDDGRFCIEGRATTPDAFLALEALGAQPPVPGFNAVPCGLEPPTITPYRWSVTHGAPDAVTVEGFYPDEAVRRQILAALQAGFPAPVAIRDGMKPGAGAPPAFIEKVRRAVSELARLRSGKAEISGDAYVLSGLGPAGYAACQALRLQIAQLDGPDSVAQAVIECPPAPPPEPVLPPLPEIPGPFLDDVKPVPSAGAPVQGAPAAADVAPVGPGQRDAPEPAAPSAPSTPAGAPPTVPSDPGTLTVQPYVLSLAVDRSGATFSGHVPDEATRAALRDQIAQTPLAGKLDDTTVILPGAPAGFAQAAGTALADLLRLDIGSAVLTDRTLALRGLTCRDLIRSEVETSAATGLPPDFTADVSVSQRQTGCVVDPPANCQNELDGLTRQNPVLFAQGTAVVALDTVTERVVEEAAAILRKCPAARVTIEGHANRDGAWRGFDNLDLSLRRAQRVRDELVRRGIDPAQLVVKGYGITRPLLPHGAPQSREMNRRVQFTVAK